MNNINQVHGMLVEYLEVVCQKYLENQWGVKKIILTVQSKRTR